MTIRVSKGSLAFAIADKGLEEQVAFSPYTIKSGVSISANLREAFKTEELLLHPTTRARVLVNAPCCCFPSKNIMSRTAKHFIGIVILRRRDVSL